MLFKHSFYTVVKKSIGTSNINVCNFDKKCIIFAL